MSHRKFLISIFLMLLSFGVNAAGVIYGDWAVDSSAEVQMTEAFTENSSGSQFGLLCLASNNICSFYVHPQTTCEDGASSSILINSDAGALATEIKCAKMGDSYFSIIQDTSSVHDAVLKSRNIGIALPMENGQFKVVRFSLVGANAAIKDAAERASRMVKAGDQIL